MRYVLDNGYYLTCRKNHLSTVTNDDGRGFLLACDGRMTDDEIANTMAEVIPFLSPRIA